MDFAVSGLQYQLEYPNLCFSSADLYETVEACGLCPVGTPETTQDCHSASGTNSLYRPSLLEYLCV